jgi:hypothetical protein
MNPSHHINALREYIKKRNVGTYNVILQRILAAFVAVKKHQLLRILSEWFCP